MQQEPMITAEGDEEARIAALAPSRHSPTKLQVPSCKFQHRRQALCLATELLRCLWGRSGRQSWRAHLTLALSTECGRNIRHLREPFLIREPADAWRFGLGSSAVPVKLTLNNIIYRSGFITLLGDYRCGASASPGWLRRQR